MLLIDVDAGSLHGAVVPELRRAARNPLAQRLISELTACVSPKRRDHRPSEARAPPNEKALQAALLTFMRDLLSVGRALRVSGDPLDGARATGLAAAEALSQDI